MNVVPKSSSEPERNKVDPKLLKKDLDDAIWETWQGAVLTKDEIKRYCDSPIKLIDPFEDRRKYLKPASYHLRLGSYYRKEGEDHILSDEDQILKIPRHGIVIVRTYERINMSGFLVGRWNLKVKMVYRGLVWVGSLQVDPGYQGYLFCPLYNLSNKEQELIYKEPLFTIDFVRTTASKDENGDSSWTPQIERSVDTAADLDTGALTTAPIEEFKGMREKLEENKKIVGNFRSRIDSFQAITFTVLGIIVAALAFVGVSKFTDLSWENPSIWQIATWIVMLSATVTMTVVLATASIKALWRK